MTTDGDATAAAITHPNDYRAIFNSCAPSTGFDRSAREDRRTGPRFPAMTTERQAVGDSRLSLEERYKDHAGFVEAVRTAARQLVKERFLLQVDADGFIAAAEASDILK